MPTLLSTADEGAANARLPSQAVRTGLTIFLFAHLFTLAIALVGRTPVTSELGRKLANARLFAAYRQLFGMDLAYVFALNRDQPTDVNHVLQATVQLPDGSTRELDFPSPPTSAGERSRHWRMLGQNMALQVGIADSEAILPTAIGGGLIDRYQAKNVNLRLRAHFLLSHLESERGDDPNAASRWRDLYQARVWRSGESIHLMKQEERGQSAPVADPRAAVPFAQ